MILHALTQYYQRKAKYDGGVAPEGFENKEIPFIIVIDRQGKFIQLEDTRELKNKKKIARTFLVPHSVKRSSTKIASNILWDNYGYVLGYVADKKPEFVQNQHKSFIEKVNELKQVLPNDIGIVAVAAFLASSEEKSKVIQDANWAECAKVKGCNFSFRLTTEAEKLVCQSKTIQDYLIKKKENILDGNKQKVCLITGNKVPVALLHNDIKGIEKFENGSYKLAKPAPLISANLDAFKSYGKGKNKDNGLMYPIGEQAMFEYTTALNTLLAGDNRFRIGDVTTVCWSEKPTPLESRVSRLINGGGKDNPDAHIDAVKTLYKSLYNGKYTESDGKDKFYLLGLSPNSARIVVRFWHETTVAALSENIAAWYDDLKMVRGENSPYPEFMPLPRLLGNLVLDGKMENLPPDLIAQITDAALNNRVLPVSLLQAALRRNKAEQKITYGRASLLKAYINRAIRAGRLKNMKELTMNLDRNRQDIGYVLGRLFAVLEKAQSYASPDLNATISDRYFSSASSTPSTVFSTLLRLNQHHLSKLNTRQRIYLDKLLQEIIGKIANYPNHLDMNQQNLFGLGYYHQKQDFYQSNSTETN
ncbi:type I-C CRISPR-associated protein Cas8c/Csd1 [Eikenella sp. S3360]|uniref:Type I-C CRISPR-associated protein Cas8c/Csd1 n=1 Tax=Eikenella glucosivorans TaxID=2766967 RepID=A0ABS0N7L7_9NEIS|nr:type I-C CRISPR-associated protein Cas8c/Csd1 [Eikenella glucosivorans]MBH5328254.1 type I-C CRISPR-associated protein Cas8c/Csd1 [Eikenella glucosivorans]